MDDRDRFTMSHGQLWLGLYFAFGIGCGIGGILVAMWMTLHN